MQREGAMRADVSLITREPDAKRSSITRTMFTGGPFRICFYGWQPSLGYSGERLGHCVGHRRESAVKQTQRKNTEIAKALMATGGNTPQAAISDPAKRKIIEILMGQSLA